MNKLNIIFLVFAFIILLSCKNESNKQNEDQAQNIEQEDPENKDVSELTYLDIFNIAFSDQGAGWDYHEDTFGPDAGAVLKFNPGELCSNKDCGNKVMLQNLDSLRSISLAIKASFNLPNNPINEMTRKYDLAPGENIPVGCSHICHKGRSYQISREILASGYVVEAQSE